MSTCVDDVAIRDMASTWTGRGELETPLSIEKTSAGLRVCCRTEGAGITPSVRGVVLSDKRPRVATDPGRTDPSTPARPAEKPGETIIP